jgi:AP2 domain
VKVIRIKLSKGYTAVISNTDAKRVRKLKWYAHEKKRADGTTKNVYAQSTIREHGKVKIVLLHRFVLGINNPKIEVDHIDHVGLHNYRSNLRAVTGQQNRQHSRRRIDNTSGYKGVYFNAKTKKWEACIKVHGKNKWLGAFNKKPSAAKAYDKSATENFGKFAVTNQTQSKGETQWLHHARLKESTPSGSSF